MIPLSELNRYQVESFNYQMSEPEGMGAFDECQLNDRTEDVSDDNCTTRKIDLSKIDNMEFDDVDTKDYPDFCDAFILSADMDGKAMSEMELEDLNENYRGFIYEKLIDKLF